MHELPVTQSILKTALKTARRINSIDLVIGNLSSFVDDSIQFYFNIISRDTIAQNAKLNFKRKTAVVTCLACSHRFNAAPSFLPFALPVTARSYSFLAGRIFI